MFNSFTIIHADKGGRVILTLQFPLGATSQLRTAERKRRIQSVGK